MGFFDFLHGGSSRKSEAEIYMEQRNREYAKKAAAYRKRELMVEIAEQMGLNSRLQNNTRKNNTKNNAVDKMARKVGDSPNDIVSHVLSNGYEFSGSSTQCAYNQTSCNTCHTDDNKQKQKDSAIFCAQSAKINPSIRTVTVNGVIKRGWFEVGDKITIISALEKREAIIAKIIRQGAFVDFANISSGEVSFIFTTIADMMIKSGDQIVKEKTGILKR
jgi:hypothetical protein